MDSKNIVEQLCKVVEDPETFAQVLGAGRANHLGWLVVRLVLLAAVLTALLPCLRLVARHYEAARAAPLPGVTPGLLLREETFWRRLTWAAFALLVVLFAVTAACDAVEVYKYGAYPRAMVLRDVLEKARGY